MVRWAERPNSRRRLLSADGFYAGAVVIWTVAVWVFAFYLARDAMADDSAGVGGNSFLLASSLAIGGVITGFSIKEFLGAYRRLRADRG
jgi:small-conductance mechanosensitive channel